MPTLTTWTFTIEDLTSTANQIKDLLATKMNLPELDNVVIVAQRPSAVGRFVRWLNPTRDAAKDDLVCYTVLTAVSPKKEDACLSTK